ncbi:hypothetical protein CBS101457_005714 [Exobasidium rhododendri]|nr:hypothetical protein CBS101457_005714 [Exobasidium rhododendri]
MAGKQIVEKLLAESRVTVFSKSYCPYCVRAKSVISSFDIPASKLAIMELDHETQGTEVQSYLLSKTGQRTVPNIFVNGKHLGGCDDLLKAQSSGSLKTMLQEASL